MTTAALQQLPLWSEGAIDGAWRVRPSRRARRLGVRVFRDGTVEVIVPPGANARAVARFVERHRSWIERHRQRATRADYAFPPERIVLPALGETWICRGIDGAASRSAPAPLVRASAAGAPGAAGAAGVGGGVLEWQAGAADSSLRAAMLEWLCARAAASLAPQLAAVAADCGLRYRRAQVRRQRTRWGSCSARGTISLNCCLLFQQPEVVRYLLVHELAHLTHLNHSPRFWRLVERHEPRWREHDRVLAAGWSQVPGWVLRTLRA
ncbi:MAG: M48 family metallopeptidase [Gammaproteobacteria bacterium]|nr:M48 family metallopeptidase [Gammaproteobacteria bacterium]MDE2250274.1 M48 family metallopeptidase [Gammaproteobacteria bacterium]